MTTTHWLLLDTETSGLRNPVYCVEIAAQHMLGLDPVGPPFRVLLDHNVPIDPAAEALHGYSREFLRQHGQEPRKAYDSFRAYTGDLAVVAYNLSFDWGRVLEPEYARLAIAPIGRPGFCAMTLARRCIYEAQSHRLDSLRALFFPGEPPQAHRAEPDLRITMKLLAEIIWPRLVSVGLAEFEDIAEFSRTTPVSTCLDRIRTARSLPPTVKSGRTAPIRATDDISEFVGLVRGVLADGKFVEAELWTLCHWLNAHQDCRHQAVERLRKVVKETMADGIVTEQELRELQSNLADVVANVG